jgi:two-component sensor histidine kinase
MSQLFRQPGPIPGLSPEASAYVWATLWVAAAFAVRLIMQPVFQHRQTYSLFYPGVVLAAYLLGRRPAAYAMLLSGVSAYFAFATPQFAWKAAPQTLTTLFFFLLNASVAIYLITALTRSLAELAASQGRAEAVAASHADLFRELNERISHHLRLVAGVLTLQAKGEPEPDVMRGLQKASERSVLMARVHRELAGHTEAPVDFDAFARGLMRSVCHARGDDTDRVQIEPARIWLPPEEATSLGMALAECVAALLSRRDCGLLRIRMVGAPSETRLLISELDEKTGASQATLSSSYLLRAMVEQLGAAIALRADGQGSALEITVPHFATGEDAVAAQAVRPSAGMLH